MFFCAMSVLMFLVGGENLIDFIQLEDQAGWPVYRANPGGSPYNVALAIARMGGEIGYLTPVSEDSLGRVLGDHLITNNVSLLNKRLADPTSLAVVSLENGAASYQFYREKTAERLVDFTSLMDAVPANAKALQLGSLALTSGADADHWAELFLAQKARGLFTSLDPNIRAPFIYDREEYLARLNRVLGATDLLKLSDEDLEWLAPNQDLKTAARDLFAKSSAKLLVVTLGSKGAFGISDKGEVQIKAAKVNGLVDTVGAGDTFMACLLAQLGRREALSAAALNDLSVDDITDILTIASKAAAINCEREGCDPPSWAEIIGE